MRSIYRMINIAKAAAAITPVATHPKNNNFGFAANFSIDECLPSTSIIAIDTKAKLSAARKRGARQKDDDMEVMRNTGLPCLQCAIDWQ